MPHLVRGMVDAKRLGFDTVEIHGASGYLLDQFFWAETNLRTDAYGGATLKQRTRFAAEVVESMRKAVGPISPLFCVSVSGKLTTTMSVWPIHRMLCLNG
ncbi:NADH oxidase [Ewingella americana]|uniref:NADH oxidase n=1 Tax=Ewingella americana TaxID=41202 RepID=A0A377TEF6_9GAMM|nr:NADH oxidase [Ewingella americana]